MLKKLAKKVAGKLGYQISRKQQSVPKKVVENKFTMQKALERSVKRGTEVGTVIDVGASDGRWSKICQASFPEAHFLMVEAQKEHEEKLKIYADANEKVEYVIAAAGRENGEIYFDNSSLFGGLASETPLEEDHVVVPVVSLDSEVKKRNLPPPYLLKLDTHGFEIPILEGATEVIKQSSLIIIETYNFKLTKDSLRFYEMCVYMKELGFSPVEMIDPMLRKHDDAFWQMDTFFIPSSHQMFQYNQYE
jgi:FkbM family methyltransferase